MMTFGIRVFGFEIEFQIPFDFFTEPSARDVVYRYYIDGVVISRILVSCWCCFW